MTSGSEATLHTSMGDVVITLFPELAPNAVANFTGLATGSAEYTTTAGVAAATSTAVDPAPPPTSPRFPGVAPPNPGVDCPLISGTPYYDGTVFHCLTPRFIIHGGDPAGTGHGGPGYEFPDEIHDMTFDQPFLVATAGRGPASHGSQFFITLRAAPHLDGDYTIFGQVSDEASQQIVRNINGLTKSDDGYPPTINTIEIGGGS